MSDISPDILENIRKEFIRLFNDNPQIASLYAKIQSGKATYIDADAFARVLGDLLSIALSHNVTEDILPDGKLYWNIAKSVIEPFLSDGYKIMVDFNSAVQEILNVSSDVKLQVVVPKLNADKVDGIITKLSNADNFGEVQWLLADPSYMQNFCNSIVDDFVRENADFQYQSGYNPVIIRVMHGKGCDWCRNLAGTYDYRKGVDRTIFKRHRGCACTVEYKCGKFSQNVYNKRLMDSSGKELTRKQLEAMDVSTLTTKESRARQLAITAMENQENRAQRERLIQTLMQNENVDHRTAAIRFTRRLNGNS